VSAANYYGYFLCCERLIDSRCDCLWTHFTSYVKLRPTEVI